MASFLFASLVCCCFWVCGCYCWPPLPPNTAGERARRPRPYDIQTSRKAFSVGMLPLFPEYAEYARCVLHCYRSRPLMSETHASMPKREPPPIMFALRARTHLHAPHSIQHSMHVARQNAAFLFPIRFSPSPSFSLIHRRRIVPLLFISHHFHNFI